MVVKLGFAAALSLGLALSVPELAGRSPSPTPFRLRDPALLSMGASDTLLSSAGQWISPAAGHLLVPAPLSPPTDAPDAVLLGRVTARVGLRRGLDPAYLMRLAKRESGLSLFARARTSSAAGPYQFTRNTWLCSIREFGPELQIPGADLIIQGFDGACFAPSPGTERWLLSLRFDAMTSTEIAVAFTLKNYHSLRRMLGRPPRMAELYALHFFGEGTGGAFIEATRSRPHLAGYWLAPKAAWANRRIFFDGVRPKSISEIWRDLELF